MSSLVCEARTRNADFAAWLCDAMRCIKSLTAKIELTGLRDGSMLAKRCRNTSQRAADVRTESALGARSVAERASRYLDAPFRDC